MGWLSDLFRFPVEPDPRISGEQREKIMSDVRSQRKVLESVCRIENMLLDMRAAHRRLERKVDIIMGQNQQILDDIAKVGAGVASLLAERADAYTNAAAANTQAAVDAARKAWDSMQAAKDDAAAQTAQAEWAEAHTAMQKVIDQMNSNQPITPVAGGAAVPSPADPAVAQQAATEVTAPAPEEPPVDPARQDQPEA